jgi:hypothetical protein
VRCLFYLALTVALFDRPIDLFKGCHHTFQRRISATTFHRAADARKRSAGVKQRQTPMFVRLSTLERYDFTEGTALVPKMRAQLQRQTCNDHLTATAMTIGPRPSQWRRPAFSAVLGHRQVPHSALIRVYGCFWSGRRAEQVEWPRVRRPWKARRTEGWRQMSIWSQNPLQPHRFCQSCSATINLKPRPPIPIQIVALHVAVPLSTRRFQPVALIAPIRRGAVDQRAASGTDCRRSQRHVVRVLAAATVPEPITLWGQSRRQVASARFSPGTQRVASRPS